MRVQVLMWVCVQVRVAYQSRQEKCDTHPRAGCKWVEFIGDTDV